jgi:hypothetical protein
LTSSSYTAAFAAIICAPLSAVGGTQIANFSLAPVSSLRLSGRSRTLVNRSTMMEQSNRSAILLGAIAVATSAIGLGGAAFYRETSAQGVAQQAQPLPPTPVLDVPGLMRLFNRPLYTGLKEKMAQQPVSQDDWNELMARGLQAAEIANLVALRPVEPERQGWRQGAADFQRAGVALSDAAKAQQWDATQKAYQQLVQACNNCHRVRAPEQAPQLEP